MRLRTLSGTNYYFQYKVSTNLIRLNSTEALLGFSLTCNSSESKMPDTFHTGVLMTKRLPYPVILYSTKLYTDGKQQLKWESNKVAGVYRFQN